VLGIFSSASKLRPTLVNLRSLFLPIGTASSKLSACGLIAAALFLCGCATGPEKFDVKVNTTANPDKKTGQSYRVVNKTKELDEGSLRYQEAERFVKTALSAKGMYEAPKAEAADVVVELDFGMKGPIDKKEERTTSFRPTVITNNDVSSVRARREGITTNNPIADAQAEVSDVERPYIVIETVYEKFISMRAHETKAGPDGATKSLWSVEVSSTDESNDLRKYLPVMASVGMDYIGTDTGGQRTVKIDEKNEAVMFVKKGM
jgi:hypothetical protein